VLLTSYADLVFEAMTIAGLVTGAKKVCCMCAASTAICSIH
jgi:hypothetical protein